MTLIIFMLVFGEELIEAAEHGDGGTFPAAVHVSIGVAILDSVGRPIAGISVTGPTGRMRQADLNHVGSLVVQAVRKLSAVPGTSDAGNGV